VTFAWQGFQIEHPEDWAPASCTGKRDEGYCRIASPETLSYQIRWRTAKPQADLSHVLAEYLRLLARDAKKANVAFSSHTEERENTWHYSWKGLGNGKGQLHVVDNRAFFIETSATTNRSLNSPHRALVDSFMVNSGDLEPWAIFGLSVRIRSGMNLSRQMFQSGRTRLEWEDKLGRIVAERWGFGEQILAKHTFESWAREALEMRTALATEVENGWEFTLDKPLAKLRGFVRFDPQRNQLITLRSQSRSDRGTATWDWLT
jgi:hypothetical protein